MFFMVPNLVFLGEHSNPALPPPVRNPGGLN